ncbi:MAG: hypothetical protein KA974_03660 [Saprospiraceae bacterium]|nr:hypothetical protein [Saprospiraceae bacterium]MBP7699523.1 hypothetical protein [Saprospiraceae bacterium]
MKIIFYVFIIVIGCGIVGCGQSSSTATLYEEVMSVHDSVMPKMSDMERAQRKLRAQLEDKNIPKDSATQQLILDRIGDLETSGEAMMQWMGDFKEPAETTPKAEAVKYLNIELLKIEEVKKDMLQSLAQADSLLATLPK